MEGEYILMGLFLQNVQKLFTSTGSIRSDEVTRLFPKVITEEINKEPLKLVSMEEVHHAIFSLSPQKPPSPNGLKGHFFKNSWKVVQTNVLRAIQDCLVKDVLPSILNLTHIALVPKIPNRKRFPTLGLLVVAISCINSYKKC